MRQPAKNKAYPALPLFIGRGDSPRIFCYKGGTFLQTIHEKRITVVEEAMKKVGMAQNIVSDPAALWYLTGETIDQGERLTVLILDAEGGARWVKNELFTLQSDDIPVLRFRDGEDGIAVIAEDLTEGTIGIDKNWPAHFLLELQGKCPRCTYVNGSSLIDQARGVKDEEEQRLMREASAANDRAMARLAAWLRPGVTENEAARYLRSLYETEGAEDVSFPPIIAFGAHGADPHHTTDDTALTENTTVLIDIGCRKERYCSDMTRTYFFGKPSEEMKKVHAIVTGACELAESMAAPGVPLKKLDAAARTYIEEAGYGPYFTHRLGHFIGQTDHEAGEVSGTSPLIAAPGMIFSIEPGIYLPGRFGVRIEDLVLITENGAEILNHISHSPWIPGKEMP